MPASIEMTMKIPDKIREGLVFLTENTGKSIVRKALISASGPATRHLRKELRILRDVSDQSTGATFRSIQRKVQYPSPRVAGYGYFYVGVDTAHSESHMKNTPQRSAAILYRNRRSAVRKDRFIGFTNKYRQVTFGKKPFKKEFVRSYQKTSLRKPRGASSQTNTPGKIWHLLEDGFTHRSGTRFKGYQYRAQAVTATTQEAIEKFDKSLERGFQRELGKV